MDAKGGVTLHEIEARPRLEAELEKLAPKVVQALARAGDAVCAGASNHGTWGDLPGPHHSARRPFGSRE